MEAGRENTASENLQNQVIGELKLMNKLVLLGEKDFYNFTEEGAFKELLKISHGLKNIRYHKRKKEIERAIADTERRSAEDPSVKKEITLMVREIQAINEEIREMEREAI